MKEKKGNFILDYGIMNIVAVLFVIIFACFAIFYTSGKNTGTAEANELKQQTIRKDCEELKIVNFDYNVVSAMLVCIYSVNEKDGVKEYKIYREIVSLDPKDVVIKEDTRNGLDWFAYQKSKKKLEIHTKSVKDLVQ